MKALALCREHEPIITALATALADRKTLDGSEIDYVNAKALAVEGIKAEHARREQWRGSDICWPASRSKMSHSGPLLSPATSLAANYYLTTSSLTFAIPLSTIPSSLAAEPETSTTRPGMYGPRSLTRTVMDRPVATFVTRNRVPNGNVR